MANKMHLNLTKPSLDQEELDAVSRVLRSGWVIRGPETSAFEEEFAKYMGAKYAIATNGCTMALYLVLKEMDLRPGDEVIVPSLTWSATASAVINAGGTPVFADIRESDWCLDPGDVKRKITKRTKLVIPVHYAARYAKGFDNFPVPVLFDSAHRVEKGDFKGITSCYSFYAVKNMTTIRGGMILTDDAKKAEWYRKGVHGGLTKDTRARYEGAQKQNDASSFYYEVEFPGWNFDMTDVEAAVGRVQLRKLPRLNARRNEIVKKYNRAFALKNTGNHLYPITLPNRDEFLVKMKEAGVQCGIHYLPLHLMTAYKQYAKGALPVTEKIGAHTVSLPLHAKLADSEVNYVIKCVINILKDQAKPSIKIKRVPTVSVGISAYNEGKNIQKVLKQVLGQEQRGWRLSDVIVIDDGSSDRTAALARKVKNQKVKVIRDENRLGKSIRLGQFFQKAKGDYFVVLDGDISLTEKNLISKLVDGFGDDEAVVLVGGEPRPYMPKSFFERAVYATYLVFNDSRHSLNGGNNIFGCIGSCLALRGSFAKGLRMPPTMNDDDFLYFSCISAGYKFRNLPNAVVNYRLPTNHLDYLRQSFRSNPPAAIRNTRKYFGDIVEREYHRPLSFLMKSILRAFRKGPIAASYIVLINLLLTPFYSLIVRRYKLSWFTASSTK